MQRTDDFEVIKELVNIKQEIEQRTGQTAKQEGRGFALPECPFCGGHDCFKITPAEKAFNCFQCEVGGSIIDYVMKEKQCSKRDTLIELADSVGHELSSLDSDVGADTSRNTVKNRIFETAAEYYHTAFMNDPRAKAYQNRKRKHSDQTLQAFRVGYTDGHLLLHLKEKKFTEEQIIGSGLAKERKGTLQDFFIAGLYIYPHIGPDGKIGHFSVKDPRKKYNYQLPSDHRDPGCLFFNMPALKSKEIMIVEGENDLLSVYGRGEYESVIACCGQLSGEQVKHIQSWASEGDEKTIYLCFDNDSAGKKYRKRIIYELEKGCLLTELSSVTKDQTVKLKVINFNKKCNDIDDFLRQEEKPNAAFRTLMENAEVVLMPLERQLIRYRNWCSKMDMKANPNKTGEIVFDYFRTKGKFFVDDDKCFLFYRNQIYEIGGSTAFKSLLFDLANLNYGTSITKQVIEVLQAKAYKSGRHTQVPGWIHTDRQSQTVFFNLNNDRNEILKIGPNSLEIVQNGTNTDQILLRDSPKMRPICFHSDADVRKAMVLLKTTVFDNLACDASDKYFIVSIIIKTILIQFTKARGITKFSGTRASGKTGAAALATTLIYGQDYVTIGSPAADFSEATRSPLTIQDNLEADTMNRLQRDFLLVAATGITKQKRKGGTDSENVYEKVCSQVIVTAIEPFFEGELISRTSDILFGEKYFNPDYIEATEVESKIVAARDMIWSAFFKIIAHDVLPDFRKKRKKALSMLKDEYGGHAKSRLNELYSCLFILCGELLKYIAHPKHSRSNHSRAVVQHLILNDWITKQDRLDRATASETNPILYRLTLLLKEYLRNSDSFEQIYMFECRKVCDEKNDPVEVQFIASTNDLYSAFEILARNRGGKCPYKSVRQLGARLKDSMNVIEDDGWNFQPRMKVVRGEPKHSFIKIFPKEKK